MTNQIEDAVLSRVMKETQERIRMFEENQRRWQDQHQQSQQHMQSPPPLTQVRVSCTVSFTKGWVKKEMDDPGRLPVLQAYLLASKSLRRCVLDNVVFVHCILAWVVGKYCLCF